MADAQKDLTLTIKQVPVAHAWAWVVDGFHMFKAYPAMWIVLFLIYLAIMIPISMLDFLGSFFASLAAPIFAAGMMVGCAAIVKNHELEINHLFAGFRHNTKQLALLGAIYMAAFLLMMIAMVSMLDREIVQQMVDGKELSNAQLMHAITPQLLIPMLLFVPVLMAYWFAPLLVRLHDLSAIEAMRVSFTAVKHNLLPVIVMLLIFLVLTIAALIPFGLGLLIVIPLTITSTYACYLDIFDC